MRSKLLVKSIPLVIAMFAPLIAQAQTKPPAAGADALLQQWDTDHDGTLTVDEVKKAADARFDALDRDHDNTLDGKELRGILRPKSLPKPTATRIKRSTRPSTRRSRPSAFKPRTRITTARSIRRNSTAEPEKRCCACCSEHGQDRLGPDSSFRPDVRSATVSCSSITPSTADHRV
jgi:hypothetical protein